MDEVYLATQEGGDVLGRIIQGFTMLGFAAFFSCIQLPELQKRSGQDIGYPWLSCLLPTTREITGTHGDSFCDPYRLCTQLDFTVQT